jgi:hypothetical protein
MSKDKGIVMANGVVLKDGLNRFKADRGIVSQSMSRIAKISKGLYSGILNSDPDFVEFQEEAMEGVITKEIDKLCDKVVLGAENQLQKISAQMVADRAANYRYSGSESRHSNVEEIDLSKGEDPIRVRARKPEEKKVVIKAQDLIKDESNRRACLNKEELENIKEVNKDVKKISDLRDKIFKKISKKKTKKSVKKVIRKKGVNKK